jgi:hypothetical protein
MIVCEVGFVDINTTINIGEQTMKANELGTMRPQMKTKRLTATVPKPNLADPAIQHSQQNIEPLVDVMDEQTVPTIMVPRKFLSDDEVNIWNAPEDHSLAFHRRHKTPAYYKMIYWD